MKATPRWLRAALTAAAEEITPLPFERDQRAPIALRRDDIAEKAPAPVLRRRA